MPTKSEQQLADKMMAEGWEVYRKGYPDFLCRKDDTIIAIEVKPNTNINLEPHQITMMGLLKSLGVECYRWSPGSEISQNLNSTKPKPISIEGVASNTRYQELKVKVCSDMVKMETDMLEMWEKGISMELLAQKFGFTDRRAVWYHINKAKNRRGS